MTPEQLDQDLVGAVTDILADEPPMTRETLRKKLDQAGHHVSADELDQVLKHCRDRGEIKRYPSSVYSL